MSELELIFVGGVRHRLTDLAGEKTLLGRRADFRLDNDLRPDPNLSREAVAIFYDGNGWWVERPEKAVNNPVAVCVGSPPHQFALVPGGSIPVGGKGKIFVDSGIFTYRIRFQTQPLPLDERGRTTNRKSMSTTRPFLHGLLSCRERAAITALAELRLRDPAVRQLRTYAECEARFPGAGPKAIEKAVARARSKFERALLDARCVMQQAIRRRGGHDGELEDLDAKLAQLADPDGARDALVELAVGHNVVTATDLDVLGTNWTTIPSRRA